MAAPTHRHGLGPSRNCLTGETKCRPSNFDVFVCIARPRGSPPVRLPWKNVRVFASTVRKFMKLFSSSNYIWFRFQEIWFWKMWFRRMYGQAGARADGPTDIVHCRRLWLRRCPASQSHRTFWMASHVRRIICVAADNSSSLQISKFMKPEVCQMYVLDSKKTICNTLLQDLFFQDGRRSSRGWARKNSSKHSPTLIMSTRQVQRRGAGADEHGRTRACIHRSWLWGQSISSFHWEPHVRASILYGRIDIDPPNLSYTILFTYGMSAPPEPSKRHDSNVAISKQSQNSKLQFFKRSQCHFKRLLFCKIRRRPLMPLWVVQNHIK